MKPGRAKRFRAVSLAVAIALTLVLSGSSFAAEPVKIGIFGPITGIAAYAGEEAKKAAMLAEKEINAAGGVNGRQVKFVIYDDRLDNKEAVAIANKMARLDKVDAAICSSFSGPCNAAAPILQAEKVPTISAYAAAVGIVKDKDYMFRWANIGDVMGYAIAYYGITKMGLKKWASLEVDNEFPKGAQRGFEEGLKKWGGQQIYYKKIQFKERDFKPYLTEIKGLNPDAIFINGFGPQIVGIRRQGSELGIFPQAKSFGMCTSIETVVYNTIGDAGTGHIGMVPFARSTGTPAVKAFVAKWKAEYGTEIISHEAGLTYDAIQLLVEAIKKGGAGREGIKAGLEAIKEYESISGLPAKFTDIHEILRPMIVGELDAAKKIYNVKDKVTDTEIIDPRPWYKYY